MSAVDETVWEAPCPAKYGDGWQTYICLLQGKLTNVNANVVIV